MQLDILKSSHSERFAVKIIKPIIKVWQ